jgi:transposase-like protein
MAELFDSATLDIPCPGCEHVNPLTIAYLKANQQFTCAGCGKDVQIETDQLKSGLKEADNALDGLRKTIRRLNKRR